MPGLDAARAFDWVGGITSRNASTLFSAGHRPVIRWIKGNGLDDVITRSAIAQATRLFGDAVDYCLCTNGIDAPRVRNILAWATRPVHWWPVTPADNPELAALLMAADCLPQHFGYWWKWFPERVRPQAPEWILDGDMVVTARPVWFEAWLAGADGPRVSAGDPLWPHDRAFYGDYKDRCGPEVNLYSGLISLPPGLRYMAPVVRVLDEQPLLAGHDGRRNMSEQGVMASAFASLGVTPIPLAEFPFARAFEEQLDFGFAALAGHQWGYHFGNAFRRENHHFVRLVDDGTITWLADEPPAEDRFAWLGNRGQWGQHGWSMHPVCVQRIDEIGQRYAGRPILEIGTSRGYLTAVLLDGGGLVTTLDQEDRGAAVNLQGLSAIVVVSPAADVLRSSTMRYALITVDLHGNGEAVWRELWPLLEARVLPGGTIVLYNSHLWMMPDWSTESGLKWLIDETPVGFDKAVFAKPLPGMVVLTAAGSVGLPPPASREPATAAGSPAVVRRPAVAIEVARRAVASWPEDARLYDVLCTAHESLGQREPALEAARRTVALAPHHPGYRERLARSLLNLGYTEDAEAEVRATLAMAPERAGAHHVMSLVLLRRDQVEDALVEARQAVRLDSARAGLQHHLGALALRKDFVDEAEEAARRAVDLDPSSPSYQLLLSRVLGRKGDAAGSLAAARSVIRLNPALPGARDWLAQLERRSGSGATGGG